MFLSRFLNRSWTIVQDEDYSEFWPYRLFERSEVFNKWYRKPTKVYESLLEFESCKKYLGLDDVTLAKVESELGPDIVEKVKSEVKENNGKWLFIFDIW